MVLKIKRFVPVLVLLFLTVFASSAFSINHAINTTWKEPENGFKHDVHSDVIPVGDPVPGGGVPDGTNQTNGNC